MTARGSAAQKAMRVDAVSELILHGASTKEIYSFAASNGWGVSGRTVSIYVRAAMDAIAETAQDSRAYRISLADRRLNMLFKRGLETGDYRTALAAQQEYNKLYGLYLSPRDTPTPDNGILPEILAILSIGTGASPQADYTPIEDADL